MGKSGYSQTTKSHLSGQKLQKQSLFCRSRRVVTEGLFCIYVFISVFRILDYTSCKTGTLGSGIRVEINVCGSITEDDFFVQPNEQLLGRTTP